ncbi:hypothetical protein GCM10017714_01870 [Curtobacterium pusillum]|uniref:Integral membrane protein n=1 Tax=Curtobacterium pusillum TaxID=69373 RepID=A0AAW3TAC0_9MICO|nr:hypothetical protein [Curtobacterium pusillum]MBA8991880.1 hypothetical protein [Curtobacterium pusillum]NUU15346.1 hypothetical protein [Curtobacterium pusillum]GLK31320.1 hypothetical protein GCM10017610_16050 [Curtobacterium pusillum]
MSVLFNILLILHFLGLAAVIGAFLVQVRRKGGFQTFWPITGLIVQLVTGLGMMGIIDATHDGGANHAKLGVKLVIAAVALVLAFVARARQKRADSGAAKPKAALPFFHSAGALAIVNVLIAVLWS